MVRAAIENPPLDRAPNLIAENAELRDALERLTRENGRLRNENRDLRATLDSYVARARSTAAFGPIEMTAGTCIGPRRSHRTHR